MDNLNFGRKHKKLMSNIKLNIKKQVIAIKHYKGNSIIRSIRSYNFIMKNYEIFWIWKYEYYEKNLSQLQVLQITSFFTVSNNFRLLFLSSSLPSFHRIIEYLSSPMLYIFNYHVDSTPNSFCHRSALFFHLTCWPGLKIPLPVLTNEHQSSVSSVYLVPMLRWQA